MTYTDAASLWRGSRPPEISLILRSSATLPHIGHAHYWANTVREFAKAKGLDIHWVFSNCTPEIVVIAGQLEELLLPIYGPDHPFFVAARSYLYPACRYVVYGDDF